MTVRIANEEERSEYKRNQEETEDWTKWNEELFE